MSDPRYKDTDYRENIICHGDLNVKGLINGQIAFLKGNFNAIIAPTVNNDNTEGYSAGSPWIDTVGDETYKLIDAATGAAVWVKTSLTADELGSMAFQAANAVAITGGTILGISGLRITAGGYANFGAATGAGGYGIRDLAGKMQFKNSGKVWHDHISNLQVTGVLAGTLTLNVIAAGVGEFNIPAFNGVVVDNYTNPNIPDITEVAYPGATNLPVTDILTQPRSYIAVDKDANVIQQLAVFTPEQHRDLIVLGLLLHSDNVNVTDAIPLATTMYDLSLQLADFVQMLGPVNVIGNVYSANGANLNLNKSVGDQYRLGANLETSRQNPSIVNIPSDSALTFRYRYQDGSGGITEDADATAVDPDQYDDGTGSLASVANNKWTIQRFWIFSTGDTRFMYGQNIYNSQSEAEAALIGEIFNSDPDLDANGSLRGWLIVKKSTTDLSDIALAKFIEADRFGAGASGGGTSSTTNLQQAYDNSVIPQILIDAINGAFTLESTTGNDTDEIEQIRNNASANVRTVDGNGTVVVKAGAYRNWGTTKGSAGYGIRDNAGAMEAKDSGGAWAPIPGPGAGDFVGPGSSTDDAIVRHDGTTGKLGANSVAILTDAGNLSGIVTFTATGAMQVTGGVNRFSRADATPAGTANSAFDDGVFGSTDTTNAGISILSSGQGGLAWGDAANVIIAQLRFQHSANELETILNSVVITVLDANGLTAKKDLQVDGALTLTEVNYTIASGSVTKTNSNMIVDTEASASADNLDNILGGTIGDIIHISSRDSGRDVTLRDSQGGTGQFHLNGSSNRVLDNIRDTITLRYTNDLFWLEEGFSSNGA